MGIFIHIAVSEAVTKKEWERVYAESLQLAKVFPLAERRKVKIRNVDTMCLVKTEEHEEVYGWISKKTRVGWCADGDYETMHTAEEYYLPKDLIGDNKVKTDAEDALVGALPAYMDYNWEDSRFCHIYSLWGNKTQGEPYHMYLLAIACMIEDRLREKAFVYGDITRGQCRKAVELANKYLAKPIDVPDRCNMERLYKRVSKLSVTPQEQLEIFETFYLGTKDAVFGEYIRSQYSEKICERYWKKRFKNVHFGTYGFDEVISEYLLWGFGLEELCSLANYNDKENIPQYEKFVKRIMDAKLHQKSKNCEDVLEINQEESSPYGVYTLMAQFAFAGARNRKVDRYIPIETIREALKKGLKNKCDVDSIIDKYLEEETDELPTRELNRENDENGEKPYEQDVSEVFHQIMDKKRQKYKENMEKYDISSYEDLLYYEKNDTMHPGLKEILIKSFVFYHSLLKEEDYKKLMESSSHVCCKWLIENNRTFLLRDKDWEKIFTNIEEHVQSFARYYPMMRVKVDSDELIAMVKAIVLNDDIYDFCKEHIEC